MILLDNTSQQSSTDQTSTLLRRIVRYIQEYLLRNPAISEEMGGKDSTHDLTYEYEGLISQANKKVPERAQDSVKMYRPILYQSSPSDLPTADEGLIHSELIEACAPQNAVASKTVADDAEGLKSEKKKGKRAHKEANPDVNNFSDEAPTNKRRRSLPKKYQDYVCN
ncbi:hypothetical protein QAD02_020652 [Eretmocerus hayati]|uniref:Uncharacterized protein n=1 Tax=Eretmocerus hayati TaxID=131215 RepID=A0ACC2PQJ8_9HYME|nr:hypothetical protein QAD02_020652 [Eretmocerus hayati]